MNAAKMFIAVIIGCTAMGVGATLFSGPSSDAAGFEKFTSAEALFHGFKYVPAVEAYQAALEQGLDERDAELATYRIGVCLQKAGQYEKSIEAYDLAMKQYPLSDMANWAQGEVERIRLHHGL